MYGGLIGLKSILFAGIYKISSVTAIARNFHEFTGEINFFVMLEGHLKSL